MIDLTSGDGALNDVSGTVMDVIYQGDSMLVMVDIGGEQRINVRLPMNRAMKSKTPEVGQKIELGLHPDDTIIVSEDAA